MLSNKEFASRLSELARIYAENEHIPQPYSLTESTEFIFCNAETFASTVKVFGPGTKGEGGSSGNEYVYFSPDLFPHLRVTAFKANVCERVVIDTEYVPEEVIPEQVVPAHTVEVVEWRCKPFTKVETHA